ncbi:uncharacterized protein I303_103839 [Kwoniella dejecticola CBS 10117]|uniref:Phytanoyl-CoA dioxygenase n=1 Tax=Kwoniella dejecticola CBS 10117 TaxID=1296121 RepID=A0A1A6A7V3_9TREE|nr:uncharacterized protein I303_03858 [Kwoniella dejecticola CBS 10117]OBR86138.1 hypothetical protein I303_03858 [Kwoniella dejecticola CBS 10117]
MRSICASLSRPMGQRLFPASRYIAGRPIHQIASPFNLSQGARSQSRLRLQKPFDEQDLDLFRNICNQETSPADYPLAAEIQRKAVIYSGDVIRQIIRGTNESSTSDLAGQTGIERLMDELHRCLSSGPGVFVIQGCVKDLKVIDRANKAFRAIIEAENEAAGGQIKGDHFAAAGHNERIWNSFQKHAETDPESFVEYYSNDVLALACEAWLGPGYQITAQANIVKPGGEAQRPHRDYHLGFQSEEIASRFPVKSQIASQLLTLQLAIAHSDMPIASGPTQLLPYSQHFDYGYLAYRHRDFRKIFHTLMVQLELKAGDAVFFNPALFHAAGDNTTQNIQRSANLLQVSACWSKPMETVDRDQITRKTWDAVQKYVASVPGGQTASTTRALLQAICDGYSFPTNLDKDPPPANGHCPPTQLNLVTKALRGSLSASDLAEQLSSYRDRRQA